MCVHIYIYTHIYIRLPLTCRVVINTYLFNAQAQANAFISNYITQGSIGSEGNFGQRTRNHGHAVYFPVAFPLEQISGDVGRGFGVINDVDDSGGGGRPWCGHD